MKTKQLEKGLLQLTDEGVAQLFTQFGGNKKIIGCVGELQFEVIQYRLLHEYSASVQFNTLPFFKACWITSKDEKKLLDCQVQKIISPKIKTDIWFISPRVNGS
jgi:peptide chain release factor 3